MVATPARRSATVAALIPPVQPVIALSIVLGDPHPRLLSTHSNISNF
jgi:hypothetical protein